MRPLVFTSLILFAAQYVAAQPDTLWTRYVETDSATVFLGAAEAANGDFLLTGVTNLRSSGEVQQQDMIIARLSASGDLTWTSVVSGGAYVGHQEQGTAVIELPNGELLVSGWQLVSGNSTRGMLLRLSSTGSLLTEYFVGGADSSARLNDLFFTPGGGQVAAVGFRRADSPYAAPNMLLSVRNFSGEQAWSAQFGMNALYDYGMRGVAVADAYYLAGYRQAGTQNYDFWLLRADTNGVQEWGTSYSHTGADELADMDRSVFGDLYLGGAGTSSNLTTGYLVKVSEDGFRDWDRLVSGGYPYSRLRGVAARPAGGAICVGTAGTGGAHRQFLLAMYTSAGDSEGTWAYGPTDSSGFYGVSALSTGGWLAFGAGVVNGKSQGFVARLQRPRGLHGRVLDREGGVPQSGVWVQRADGWQYTISTDDGYYALELPAGTFDFILSGACVETDTLHGITVTDNPDLVTDLEIGVPDYAKHHTSINLLAWNDVSQTSPVYLYNSGSGALRFRVSVQAEAPVGPWLSVSPAAGLVGAHDSIAVMLTVAPDTTNDGVYDFAGTLSVRTNSCPDSTDAIPILVTVLDAAAPPSLAHEFRLWDAYPNPFNARTTIRYALPRDSRVSLRVFDIQGRESAVLVDAAQRAGLHELSFDGTDLATGMYFAVLRAGAETRMTKLLLLK
ncbi:T9SS type A sorting domain-containing protein [candidate division KSB1 bacterium]|nr:T9SS type A sorting domain-containing protein [candidate division KSB1 bacterium]